MRNVVSVHFCRIKLRGMSESDQIYFFSNISLILFAVNV